MVQAGSDCSEIQGSPLGVALYPMEMDAGQRYACVHVWGIRYGDMVVRVVAKAGHWLAYNVYQIVVNKSFSFVHLFIQ